MSEPESADPAERAPGRAQMLCIACGTPMRFDGGRQIHDLWAERFVCETCGAERYRSYGRGSV